MYREIILRVGNSVLSFIQLSFLGFGRKFPYVDKQFLRYPKPCLFVPRSLWKAEKGGYGV